MNVRIQICMHACMYVYSVFLHSLALRRSLLSLPTKHSIICCLSPATLLFFPMRSAFYIFSQIGVCDFVNLYSWEMLYELKVRVQIPCLQVCMFPCFSRVCFCLCVCMFACLCFRTHVCFLITCLPTLAHLCRFLHDF